VLFRLCNHFLQLLCVQHILINKVIDYILHLFAQLIDDFCICI